MEVITKEYQYKYNGKTKRIKRTYTVKPKQFTPDMINDYKNRNRESLQSLPLQVSYERFKNNTNTSLSFSWFYNHIIKGC